MLLVAARADSAKWISNLFKLDSKIYPVAPTEHIAVLQQLLEAAACWSGGWGRPEVFTKPIRTSTHNRALEKFS